jgi:uncharacterized protein DUF6580
VTGESTRQPQTRFKPMTLALAGVAVLAAAISLLPPTDRPWNLSPIGALGLFAAARLGFWPAIGLTALALGLKDLSLILDRGWEPAPFTWLCFAAYVALGWALLRRTESPFKIGGATLAASLIFFLVSNFGSWIGQALPYGYSFAGLIDCYVAGIPFYRGTLIGDLVFSGGLFAAHAALSRAYFPAERVAVLTVESNSEMEEKW